MQVPQVALAEALQGWIKYFPRGQAHCRQTTSAVALQAPNEVSPDEQLHRRQTVSAVALQATTLVVPLLHAEQALQRVFIVALHPDTKNSSFLQEVHDEQNVLYDGEHCATW